MCDADGWEGGAMLEKVNGRGWPEHVPNASDEGWDGTRADVSGYAPDDTQSTHDERRNSRLPLHDEGVGRGRQPSVEGRANDNKRAHHFPECLEAF